jgi:hypothetical protein
VPFHTAQFALNGLSDEHVREASWVAQSVTGASAYLHGIGYSVEQFKKELERTLEHLKEPA